MIGELDSVVTGTAFETRRALYDAGVHRQLQAGIVGGARTGAESIVLSGGYVDDEDHGAMVIYTGHGGRDPRTGRQVADQSFTGQNAALVTSRLHGLPVRVVRGAQHRSPYSPAKGYRYDGLFFVEDHWREKGQDGFLVCRFRLISTGAAADPLAPPAAGTAPRVWSAVQRIIRDTKMSRRVKEMHQFRCQVCGETISTPAGPYAEGAHIRPLGAPHNGPDEAENLLCLCANHHVLFDYGSFTIADDFTLIGLPGRLRTLPGHPISRAHLAYRRSISM